MNITNPAVFNKDVLPPYTNVDPRYVNIDSSNDPANFTSKATGVEFGLPRIVDNVAAANASIMKGGRRRGVSKKYHKYDKKTLKKKIKNVVNKYKGMKGGKKKITMKSLKRKIKSIFKGKYKNKRSSKKRATRKYRGGQAGYTQLLSNVPYTPSYSTGGILTASQSALANPVPYQAMNNCVDNYNHFTGKSTSY